MPCRIDQYFGLWLVEQSWFRLMLEAHRQGMLQPEMRRDEDGNQIQGLEAGPNGMAILPIQGHMMKDKSSFGGCSTVACRRMVREAVRNDTITGLMLYVDSPGGTASGTFELANEVERAAQHMPVRAHIEDIGASAAYWVASQAQHVTANTMAEVGSIGTVAMVVDDSKKAEAEGVKVHVISTGEFKGAGAPGTAITERQLEAFREQVADVNEYFQSGVRAGRGLDDDQLAAVSDGRVFIAQKAQGLGLIDGVASFEDSVADFAQDLQGRSEALQRDRAIRMTEAELL